MTFNKWKESQKWLNPVPDDLSITDLNSVWNAAKQDSDKVLDTYKRAVNRIDDFFEYQYKSYSKDDIRKFVYEVLNGLTQKLKDESEG